mmetsp:Transcript_10633/g.16213  ORF Transcript_10633/g.16213 Transcript_10633/m.16213 type:complete len:143 (-) Transcript_10633:244-672(-)
MTFISQMQQVKLNYNHNVHRMIFTCLHNLHKQDKLTASFGDFIESVKKIQAFWRRCIQSSRKRKAALYQEGKDELERLILFLEFKKKQLKANASLTKKTMVGGFSLDKVTKSLKALTKVSDPEGRDDIARSTAKEGESETYK